MKNDIKNYQLFLRELRCWEEEKKRLQEEIRKTKKGPLLEVRRQRLECMEQLTADVQERIQKAEAYVQSIQDPFVREAVRQRFVLHKSWKAVSAAMGEGEDTLRVMVARYLGQNETESI